LPARRPYAAVRELERWLQRTAACVTPHKVVISRGGREPSLSHALPHTAKFASDPAPLGGSGLLLSVAHHYRVVRAGERGPWRVQTAGYYYGFDDADGREILAYHWHPVDVPDVPFPHIHVGPGVVRRESLSLGGLSLRHNAVRADVGRAHLPTRRIAFEDVVRLAIEQLGVEPLHAGWDAVLRETRSSFSRNRTWI